MAAERKTIILVDDNMTNLAAGKDILRGTYRTYPVPSADRLFELLENLRPDMILLDIEMPGMDGYGALTKLKANPQWADIPVLFITARTDQESRIHGLDLGALDYVVKPFKAQAMLDRIAAHLARP